MQIQKLLQLLLLTHSTKDLTMSSEVLRIYILLYLFDVDAAVCSTQGSTKWIVALALLADKLKSHGILLE